MTFDDGYESVFTNAFPIINDIGGKGSVFIISDFIGHSNRWDSNIGFLTFPHLSVNQIRELSSAGWTIGSHTRSHKCLIGMNEFQLKNELEGSKKKLEDLIGTAIEYLVPPFGKADRKIIETALDYGYKKILLPLTFNRFNYPDFNCLYRWNMYSKDTDRSFLNRLKPKHFTFQLTKQMVISFCNNASIAANSIQ